MKKDKNIKLIIGIVLIGLFIFAGSQAQLFAIHGNIGLETPNEIVQWNNVINSARNYPCGTSQLGELLAINNPTESQKQDYLNYGIDKEKSYVRNSVGSFSKDLSFGVSVYLDRDLPLWNPNLAPNAYRGIIITPNDMIRADGTCTITYHIEFAKKPVCVPNWVCTDWGECGSVANNREIRNCRDLNECGIGGRPAEYRSCIPSEEPEEPVIPEELDNTFIIIGIVVLILFIFSIFMIFKKLKK